MNHLNKNIIQYINLITTQMIDLKAAYRYF